MDWLGVQRLGKYSSFPRRLKKENLVYLRFGLRRDSLMHAARALLTLVSAAAGSQITECGAMESPKHAESASREHLYSRQIYALGGDAMSRIAAATVLIVGLRGAGVEVAKNVVLAGVRSVTLLDLEPVSFADLSSQFFCTEADVKRRSSRGEATLPRLAVLNTHVAVRNHQGEAELTPSFLSQFDVAVAADLPLEKAIAINEASRASGVHFVLCQTFGLFGGIFSDFGDRFTVYDADGEEPASAVVAAVAPNGVINTVMRNGFQSGDWVSFDGDGPYRVRVFSPFSFEVDDPPRSPRYKVGGMVRQVKKASVVAFKPLRASLAQPDLAATDSAKPDRALQMHHAIRALHAYVKAHGHLPPPSNATAAALVLRLAREADSGIDLSPRLVTNLVSGARGQLAPVCAFLGGMAAQEVLKAITGRFMPLRQWLYYDAEEVLPAGGRQLLPPEHTQPRGSRYDSQALVIGWPLQERLAASRWLLLGAGAIGCEVLKLWAMMGLGVGEGGGVVVADPDTIETSNLNRQFLFRPNDVAQPKATVAAAAVIGMNKAMRIDPQVSRVNIATASHFDDVFWEGLTGVFTAVDNVEARLFADSRCVVHGRALIDAGTLGPKGSVQVVVPKVTESYGSSRDPPEKAIPVCTLKNFPFLSELIEMVNPSRERCLTP